MAAVSSNKYPNNNKINNDEEEIEFEDKPLPPLEIKPHEHRLQYTYCVWYSQKATAQNFTEKLKLLSRFATVEQFWSVYCHLTRPSDLITFSHVHVFRDGIKPTWEDPANRNGGKWVVRFRKTLTSRCWENLLLAMVGEQFMVGEEICGIVVGARFQEDIISVWNRTAGDTATTTRIHNTLRRVLGIPPNIMEYKTHDESLKRRGLMASHGGPPPSYAEDELMSPPPQLGRPQKLNAPPYDKDFGAKRQSWRL